MVYFLPSRKDIPNAARESKGLSMSGSHTQLLRWHVHSASLLRQQDGLLVNERVRCRLQRGVTYCNITFIMVYQCAPFMVRSQVQFYNAGMQQGQNTSAFPTCNSRPDCLVARQIGGFWPQHTAIVHILGTDLKIFIIYYI